MAFDSRLLTKSMRAQRASFLFLACRGGEGRDLGAKDPGKLDGQVSQAADAHNAHPRRRVDAMGAQRVIDRDAAAKQAARPVRWPEPSGIGITKRALARTRSA